MKLTQLEYFCVAARYHNITKASKELFVTQPSVSNAIKALEEEFGVNLFYRNNNKLTLTPEGEIFYKQAEELLAHADSVASEFHELRKRSRQSVSGCLRCLEVYIFRICIFLYVRSSRKWIFICTNMDQSRHASR